jgi:alpha-beta hydrolase superfamily lysophospholipase
VLEYSPSSTWIVEADLALTKWKGDLLFVFLVAVLVAAWIYLYPDPSSGPLSPLAPPPGLQATELPTYASSEGLGLTYRHYEPHGEAERVLILLHDTLLHSGWYESLGQDLAARGVGVYLPDRRGWGQSGGDRRQVSENRPCLLEDITAMLAVAQARYPQSRIYLGGHGRAAGLVLQYAATQRPLDGVVLIAPILSDDQPNLRAEGWQELVSAHPGEAFLARAGLAYWPVWRYNWPPSMLQADPLLESRISISWQQETVPSNPADLRGSPHVPLLYLQGGTDPLFELDATAELIERFDMPDKHLEIWDGADYLTIIEAAAEPISRWMAGR